MKEAVSGQHPRGLGEPGFYFHCSFDTRRRTRRIAESYVFFPEYPRAPNQFQNEVLFRRPAHSVQSAVCTAASNLFNKPDAIFTRITCFISIWIWNRAIIGNYANNGNKGNKRARSSSAFADLAGVPSPQAAPHNPPTALQSLSLFGQMLKLNGKECGEKRCCHGLDFVFRPEDRPLTGHFLLHFLCSTRLWIKSMSCCST